MAALVYSYQNAQSMSPGLTSPSDRRINTYAFTSYAIRRIWDLTQVYLEQELAIDVLLHPTSPSLIDR